MTLAQIIASRTTTDAPPFVGKRFDARGGVLACSGSTVIGHLRDPARTAFTHAVRHISDSPAADCWAWLPTSSYHMTIFDLLLHDRRESANRPHALPPDASPQETDRHMLALLGDFEPDTEPVFKICVRAIEPHKSGIWARVEPASASEEIRIRRLRDRLARHVGLDHRSDHASYSFHVTLAYAIGWPTHEQAAAIDAQIGEADAALREALPVFEIGPPEVCLFDDMQTFRTQFTIPHSRVVGR